VENKLEHDDEIPEPITSAGEKRNSRRLGIKEFFITLIIIGVVWAARKCFSTHRLDDDIAAPHLAPVSATVVSESSVVFEKAAIMNSSEMRTHDRAADDKPF
jgi:hypothetical protein